MQGRALPLRRGQWSNALAGRLEGPSVLPDGDDSDQSQTDLELDRLTERRRRLDAQHVISKFEQFGAEHEVAPAAGPLLLIGLPIGTGVDGDFNRALPLVDLFQAAAPSGRS